MVNIVLKGYRGIIKAEQYNKGLKKAKLGDKGCFPFMAFYDPELIKHGDNIQFSVDFSVAQGVQRFLDQRQGVPVFNGDTI